MRALGRLLLVAVACGCIPGVLAAEPLALEGKLADIERRLTANKAPSKATARQLVDLSRRGNRADRGRLLLWMIDQPADLRLVVRQATFSGARLSGARLAGATLADRLKNRPFDKAYRSPDYQAGRRIFSVELEGINLSGARLDRADLHRANLQRANLRRSSLRGANLKGAILNGANLAGADLSGADLRDARLVGADLRGIRQKGTRWEGAVLIRALRTPRRSESR